MDNRKGFPNNLRERRQRLGLSQIKVACAIGMSASNLSMLEAGRCKAWPKARRDLATALDMGEDELFPANEYPPNSLHGYWVGYANGLADASSEIAKFFTRKSEALKGKLDQLMEE